MTASEPHTTTKPHRTISITRCNNYRCSCAIAAL